jgi:hypothetical protein
MQCTEIIESDVEAETMPQLSWSATMNKVSDLYLPSVVRIIPSSIKPCNRKPIGTPEFRMPVDAPAR